MSDEAAEAKTCTFTFKRRGRGRGGLVSRRRHGSSSSSSSADETAVVRTNKKRIANPMIQKSSALKKVKVNAGGSSSSDDEQGTATTSRQGSTSVTFASTGAEVKRDDQNATAIRQLDTEQEKDARSIHERSMAVNSETKDKEDDKVYRGMNNYAQYIEKREPLIGNRITIKGPIRAPTNIRSTVRWDYDPMICKDFKETGYCGFGDSCKFMHDRSDYKMGWQLEREVEQGTYEESDDDKYVIDSDEDDLPEKCPICRRGFTNPIITRCKHHFCEKCAIENYKESQRCYSCGKQTMGTFNPAHDLKRKMERLEAAGKTFDSSDDEEESADESKKRTIPEDDPNYYTTVHNPHE